MAFVRCRNCDWQQDDFWSPDGYHPFRKDALEEWESTMVRALKEGRRRIEFDSWFLKERHGWDDAYDVDFRQYLADELERTAAQLRGMHWATEEDFEQDSNRACPRCLSNNLTVD